jgi:hypothetical protein
VQGPYPVGNPSAQPELRFAFSMRRGYSGVNPNLHKGVGIPCGFASSADSLRFPRIWLWFRGRNCR